MVAGVPLNQLIEIIASCELHDYTIADSTKFVEPIL